MDKDNKISFIKGDNIINIALFIFAIFMLFQSKNYTLEARRFPQSVAGVMLVLSGYTVVISFLKYKKNKVDEVAEVFIKTKRTQDLKDYSWLMVIAFGILYFMLLRPLGFIITTMAIMIATPIILGYKKYIVIIVLALTFTLGFYWIFTSAFFIPLPKGIL